MPGTLWGRLPLAESEYDTYNQEEAHLQSNLDRNIVDKTPEMDQSKVRERSTRVFGAPLGPGELPRDHPSRVYQDPSKFGSITFNKEQKVVEITLHKHGMWLTAAEKEYMRSCLKLDKTRGQHVKAGTSRHDYVDVTRTDMWRCPLTSCTYRPLNQRNLKQSLRAHCGAYHKTKYKYRYRFKTQYGWGVFEYPIPEEIPLDRAEVAQPEQMAREQRGEVLRAQAKAHIDVCPTHPNPQNPVMPRQTVPTAPKTPAPGKRYEAPKPKSLVAQGTRYRRRRTEEDQPKLFQWIASHTVQPKENQRHPAPGQNSAGSSTDMRNVPEGTPTQPSQWDARRDNNAYRPLVDNIHHPEETGDTSRQAEHETADDWWAPVIHDE